MAQQSTGGKGLGKANPVPYSPAPEPKEEPKKWIGGGAPRSRTPLSLALARTRIPFAV